MGRGVRFCGAGEVGIYVNEGCKLPKLCTVYLELGMRETHGQTNGLWLQRGISTKTPDRQSGISNAI